MREAFASRASFSNVTWPAFDNVTTTFTVDMINCCLLGVPLNLIIIYLSFISAKLDGENFKYFLGNLAICDLGFCFGIFYNWAQNYYFVKNDIPQTAIMCSLQISFCFDFGFATALALPLVPMNRYFEVVLKSTWFTKPRVILLCLYPYILGFAGDIHDYLLAPYVTFFPRCGYNLYTPFIPEYLLLPISLGYTVAVYCNYKVHGIIAKHIRASKRSTHSALHIVSERSVLRASIYQSCIPILSVIPVTVYLISITIFGWSAAEFVLIHVGQFNLTVDDVGFGVMMFQPTATALITLLVVKPYNDAVQSYINAVKKRCGFNVPVAKKANGTTITVHNNGLTANML